jgi:hypothetical protein
MALPKSKEASTKLPRRTTFEDSIPADNSTLPRESGSPRDQGPWGDLYESQRFSMVEHTKVKEEMETGSPSI